MGNCGDIPTIGDLVRLCQKVGVGKGAVTARETQRACVCACVRVMKVFVQHEAVYMYLAKEHELVICPHGPERVLPV